MTTNATIISLGPDTEVDSDWASSSGFDVVVYHYTSHEYDGSGFMVARSASTGLWTTHNMGHCSCYGSTDDMSVPNLTAAQMLAEVKPTSPDDFDYSMSQAIYEAVLPIVSGGT